jgi:hypothetical protein
MATPSLKVMRSPRRTVLCVVVVAAAVSVVLSVEGGSAGAAGRSRLINPVIGRSKWKAGRASGVVLAEIQLKSLPKGSTATVRCGSGCSLKQQRRAGKTGVADFTWDTPYFLPAGSVLVVEVTKPRRIGYYQTWKVQSSTLVKRDRLCVLGEGPKPRACSYTLKVTMAGTGSGHVRSPGSPGIDCSSPGQDKTCSAKLDLQSRATLRGAPDPGSTFAGWSGGGCFGIGPCTITMSGAKKVEALFVPAGTYEVAFRDSNGQLDTFSSVDQQTPKRTSAKTVTNPSIAGFEVAFRTGKGRVNTYATAAGQVAVRAPGNIAAGTSPSIAVSSNGSYAIAFQDSNGYLSTYTSATNRTTTIASVQRMKARTSPSIAALPGGHYEIAFQARDGFLHTYSTAAAHRPTTIAQGMNPLTSPSIAALRDGSYAVAFQTNRHQGYKLDTYLHSPASQHVKPTGQGMDSGTSPSIAASPGGGYEIAYQINDPHYLRWASLSTSGQFQVTTNPNTKLGMMQRTNPSIAALSTGYVIAFQGKDHYLWIYSSATGQATSTGVGADPPTMQAGASPSIEGS